MKKMLALFPVAACLTLLGVASLGEASAAPKIGRAKRARTIRIKSDLKCTIQAFEDAAGMKPVANGGTLGYGGGSPSVWVRMIVENTGGRSADGFQASVGVWNKGTAVFSKTESLTVPGGLAKIYPLVQVPLHKSNKITAQVSVDTGNAINESNEHNNSCSFAVDAAVVH